MILTLIFTIVNYKLFFAPLFISFCQKYKFIKFKFIAHNVNLQSKYKRQASRKQ
jgi:hypothetical protein